VGDTEIEWCKRPGTRARTWNPVQGCRRISAGCEHCYAERMAARFAVSGWSQGLINLKTKKWNGNGRLADHKLAEPLSWRDPSTVFVNSMSDLFYEAFTNEQIAAVFGVMAACPQHTFQVLTKRAERMRQWFQWVERIPGTARSLCLATAARMVTDLDEAFWSRKFHEIDATWPLPNVWLGVSVENQEAAYDRIGHLLMTPAAIRFLSIEPMIGPVDLLPWFDPTGACDCPPEQRYCQPVCMKDAEWRGAATEPGDECPSDPRIDWAIVGCESGPGARPCDVEWIRAVRDDCATYGTAFFLKQAVGQADPDGRWHHGIDGGPGSGTKRAGQKDPIVTLPYLDGVQHAQFPEVS